MRIAIVHGYFLGDSGSGVYVRQTAEALVAAGHDVTLVCQEREPERYCFVESAWALDADNTEFVSLGPEHDNGMAGSCRLVRPNDGGQLLVYVDGPFAGFTHPGISTFQDAPAETIDAFISANVAALRAIFDRWPPELVLAHHTIAQPHIVREALAGLCPYVVTVHGSELNFSLRVDPRLTPIGLSGLAGARAVVALTADSLADVTAWAADNGLDIADKGAVVPPGVDTELFVPAADRAEAITALERAVAMPEGFELRPEDDVIAFAGRVGWNKGIQHLVVAASLLAASRPSVKLLVAGEGPARASLERLAALLGAGDAQGARQLALTDPQLGTAEGYGPMVPDGSPELGRADIAYLGHLPASGVARVFAAADVAVAPSVFPEAAALVTSEALSAGALPVVANHTGLMALANLERDTFADETFRALVPGADFSARIADVLSRQLDAYPTANPAFRARLHGLATAHFPSWAQVTERYIALGTGTGGGAPSASAGGGGL